MSLDYQLCARRPLVPILHGVQCMPEYFIVGGLVFVPLSIPFLEHAYGESPYIILQAILFLKQTSFSQAPLC